MATRRHDNRGIRSLDSNVGDSVGALLGATEGNSVGLTCRVRWLKRVRLTIGADERAALLSGVGLPTLCTWTSMRVWPRATQREPKMAIAKVNQLAPS